MEFTDKINQKLDMLDKIYLARQEELEQEDKEMKENLKKQLNKVSLEEIEETIQNNQFVNKEIEKQKKDIIHKIELLIENYELQIAYYSEKNYKRGFKDAICLCTQCFSNTDDEK